MDSKVNKILDAFSGQSLAVVGDVMLDKYVWGSSNRISQEAPVPVVLVKKETYVPGGAANVARNVLSLGGSASIFGVIGNDIEGTQLSQCLVNDGVDTSTLLKSKSRATTVKTRVLAGNQQVVRIDREETDDVSTGERRAMLKALEEVLKSGKVCAVILEDYAKGLFSKSFMAALVELCRRYKVMSALDPHPRNPYNIKGLTFMTPNRNEAFALAGVKYVSGCGNPLQDTPLLNVASRLMHKWQPKYLLITLGAEGMALFSDDKSKPLHIPTQARQVFDVSGAGDTVMATMMLALMSGASPDVAAQIANQAAGIVVGRVGTSAIEAEVLKKTIHGGL